MYIYMHILFMYVSITMYKSTQNKSYRNIPQVNKHTCIHVQYMLMSDAEGWKEEAIHVYTNNKAKQHNTPKAVRLGWDSN